MSDNKSDEEQQQQMEEIFICADVLLGVFTFLDPVELGLKLTLISDRLDVLVDVHFKSRKWSLSWMEIRRAIGGNDGAQIVNKRSGEVLPIPQRPLPNKVIGFEEIQISYVDQTVIEFLQRIRRLFDSAETTVYISTSEDQSRSMDIIWQKIWPLFNDNICGFFLSYSRLDCLLQFSPTILCNCAKLRSIDSGGIFPAFSAEDNAGASSRQTVGKWLLTPRGDGFPKMLFCGFYSEGMEGLKRSFVNASEPVNFIIITLNYWGDEEDPLVPFELNNNATGERLTFRRFDEDFWLLVRCPIGREEDKWTNWEEEAIGWTWCRQWNRILIDFKDTDIGDGMLDEKDGGGPSEPKK
ncbi:hypothetical protein GPALN_003146 [Globodera pallida]|nr:hypothetical protein GPALN_003146 [Globodera pallida]